MNNALIVMCLLAVCGCGLFGDGSVPKEQIDQDLAKNSVMVKYDGLASQFDWGFTFVSIRCFSINKDETKITPRNADVSITVASWREDMGYADPSIRRDRPDQLPFNTLFGKLMLHYKKDADKWVFERLEPTELIQKDVGEEDLKNFIEISKPYCQSYSKRGKPNPG